MTAVLFCCLSQAQSDKQGRHSEEQLSESRLQVCVPVYPYFTNRSRRKQSVPGLSGRTQSHRTGQKNNKHI